MTFPLVAKQGRTRDVDPDRETEDKDEDTEPGDSEMLETIDAGAEDAETGAARLLGTADVGDSAANLRERRLKLPRSRDRWAGKGSSGGPYECFSESPPSRDPVGSAIVEGNVDHWTRRRKHCTTGESMYA